MSSDEEKTKQYDYFNSNFDSSKYKDITVGPAKATSNFVDGSDAFANQRKMFVSFQHVPTGRSVFFKAFITAFNEAFNCDWASETVYGRADPIYLYKSTQRQITLAFKIPASSQSEAYENLGKVQGLLQFLYPNYTDIQNAMTVAQSPLIRLKVMNLLRNTNDRFENMDADYGSSPTVSEEVEGHGSTGTTDFDNYANLQTWQSHDGILGAIANIAINHNLEGDDGSFVVGTNALLPKFLDVNLTFNPIHEHPLGWDDNGVFAGTTGGEREGEQRLWPYGVRLTDGAEMYEDMSDRNQKYVDEQIQSGSSFTDLKENAEAAVANAEAKYAGLFGSLRAKKDWGSEESAAIYLATQGGVSAISAYVGQQGPFDDPMTIEDVQFGSATDIMTVEDDTYITPSEAFDPES